MPDSNYGTVLQAGDTKAAIDCCVLLHQWDQALQLAQQYNYPQAEGLLQQYAGHLLDKKKYLEAVELYRKVCIVLMQLLSVSYTAVHTI